MRAALEAIPTKTRQFSLCKWRHLLGLLQIIAPAVSGAQVMLTRLQHSLRQARGSRVLLLTAVHDKLSAWRQLVHKLAARPKHLCDLDPFSQTWERATDASGAGMGGVCQDLKGQWFIWRSPFSKATQARLATDTNPTRDVTINNLELSALFGQVQLFTPKMAPLAHIRTTVDNTAAQGWDNRGSVSSATAVGPILRDLALLKRTHKIYSSVKRIAGVDNNMDDAASRLTHLTDNMFLRHFFLTFPQRKPWRMITLPAG